MAFAVGYFRVLTDSSLTCIFAFFGHATEKSRPIHNRGLVDGDMLFPFRKHDSVVTSLELRLFRFFFFLFLCVMYCFFSRGRRSSLLSGGSDFAVVPIRQTLTQRDFASISSSLTNYYIQLGTYAI